MTSWFFHSFGHKCHPTGSCLPAGKIKLECLSLARFLPSLILASRSNPSGATYSVHSVIRLLALPNIINLFVCVNNSVAEKPECLSLVNF